MRPNSGARLAVLIDQSCMARPRPRSHCSVALDIEDVPFGAHVGGHAVAEVAADIDTSFEGILRGLKLVSGR